MRKRPSGSIVWRHRPAQRGGAITYLYDPRLQAADPEEAANYRQAATRGDPVAQFMTGFLLINGAQSGADYREAAQFFAAAAQRGLPAAMANLGLLHFEGKGVLQDYVEGYKWLTLAALNGPPGAVAMRDMLARRLTADQINGANALAEAFLSEPR